MRTCPFTGCGVKIRDELFACLKHWRSLGPEAKTRINEAYANYLEGTVTIEELRRIQQDVLGPRGTA